MQHRGTARRRVLIISGGGLPAQGTEITANGRPVGTLGSASGGKGLAILRIDRVKDALDAGQPEAALTAHVLTAQLFDRRKAFQEGGLHRLGRLAREVEAVDGNAARAAEELRRLGC